ncbi:MAG: hypothetical protein A3F13_06210 [Gammaproteobacteria bacterium RIFCSPHIGHO2_12_FULL_40_19]|nr:MAG: hypothetical protein A3F13_06210 [Gammaproteobacteria bacterium RIFCSPHIGHO2_12_FULL_40_19]
MKTSEARAKGYSEQTDTAGNPSHFESREVSRVTTTTQAFFRAACATKLASLKAAQSGTSSSDLDGLTESSGSSAYVGSPSAGSI